MDINYLYKKIKYKNKKYLITNNKKVCLLRRMSYSSSSFYNNSGKFNYIN